MLIFTPTYNRSNTLPRLYNSLLNQSLPESVHWLLVDDGSTDDTECIVKAWQAENRLKITYVKQANGGKYRAFNTALDIDIDEVWIFTVDSDDWLPKNALSKLSQIIATIEDAKGVIAIKSDPVGKTLSKPFTEGLALVTLHELENKGIHGEWSLIFHLPTLRKYRFPDCGDQKFCTEAVLYDQFASDGHKMKISNEILTACEYQTEGLSSNPRELMGCNPIGYTYYYGTRIDRATSFKRRVQMAIQYLTFDCMAQHKGFHYQGKHSTLLKILTPLRRTRIRFYRTISRD
ncbi:MAG: glycosyltransferase family 2 protein [Bacteroidales bacterium]|nr:glycosyltransferase family 2 protein [Bacteroidales bacterium]